VGTRLLRAKAHLDSVVHGHACAKQVILERAFSWFTNPTGIQRPLALCGPPGNGKTTLVKMGLSYIMERAFNFITLGGSADASTLVGHGYTFEGSQPGRIVECLWNSKCMNPVIYFDELDKISETSKGDEISNILIHLTDTSQNEEFRDKYLHGIDLDISRSLLVFSMNDMNKVNPILIDRIQVVQTETFNTEEQRKIVKSFLIPQCIQRSNSPPGIVDIDNEGLDILLQSIDSKYGVRGALGIIDELISKVLIWKSTQEKELIYPLMPLHMKENNGIFILGREAVQIVSLNYSKLHKREGLSMYS
jgi:ATP-dependent Lon protease